MVDGSKHVNISRNGFWGKERNQVETNTSNEDFIQMFDCRFNQVVCLYNIPPVFSGAVVAMIVW